MQKRVLIWGTGKVYDRYINSFKYFEMLHNVLVVGITSRENCYSWLDGYKYYDIPSIKTLSFDNLVIAAEGQVYSEIKEQAEQMGVKENLILKISLFFIPGFDIDNYIMLRNSNMSIISINCWGGVISHRLELPFLSPFVNLWIKEEQYIQLLKELKTYLQYNLVFDRWETKNDKKYPVMKLKDIELFFLHYTSIEEAKEKWYRRLERINYDNLFVMMFTTDRRILAKFDNLPYDNKICFVPFKSELCSAYHVELANRLENIPFYEIINLLSWGALKEYDTIKLLCGEKRKRIDL